MNIPLRSLKPLLLAFGFLALSSSLRFLTPNASAVELTLSQPAKITTVVLKLSGLHCAACSLKIRHALKGLNGIVSLSEGESKKLLVIEYNNARTGPPAMIKKIEETGYQASIVK